MYLNQIWYQDVLYIPFNVYQIWRQSDYVFTFYGSFLQVCEKKKRKKTATFWRLIFQEKLVWFASDLVSVLPICRHLQVNLVLFSQETTELQTCIKSYFVLRVNIHSCCACTPHFFGLHKHTTVCLDHAWLCSVLVLPFIWFANSRHNLGISGWDANNKFLFSF